VTQVLVPSRSPGDTAIAMDRLEILRNTIRDADQLRATGPTTDSYLRWRDGVDELLADLLGPDHRTRRAFQDAVTPDRALDAEGIQIEGAHGMVVRIDQGVAVIRTLLGE